jgi:hypothetical protein
MERIESESVLQRDRRGEHERAEAGEEEHTEREPSAHAGQPHQGRWDQRLASASLQATFDHDERGGREGHVRDYLAAHARDQTPAARLEQLAGTDSLHDRAPLRPRVRNEPGPIPDAAPRRAGARGDQERPAAGPSRR